MRRILYGLQLFIPNLLLRTLRFPEIKTCETADGLGQVIGSIQLLKKDGAPLSLLVTRNKPETTIF